jgi:hypothetical protein
MVGVYANKMTDPRPEEFGGFGTKDRWVRGDGLSCQSRGFVTAWVDAFGMALEESECAGIEGKLCRPQARAQHLCQISGPTLFIAGRLICPAEVPVESLEGSTEPGSPLAAVRDGGPVTGKHLATGRTCLTKFVSGLKIRS